MKKPFAIILSILFLISSGTVQAFAAEEGGKLEVTPAENTTTVLAMENGSTIKYDGYLKASELEDSALADFAESYQVFYNGEQIISVELNDIKGGDNSVGASQMMNGYYAIDFTYGDKQECFITGLKAGRVDEIETKMISACNRGGSFTVTDIGFIDTEKENVEGYDSQLCWAGATANALTYTGWAQYAGFDNEDDLFDLYAESFNDDGAVTEYGATWFFNGVGETYEGVTATPNDPDSGAYAPDYASETVVTKHYFDSTTLCKEAKALKDDLRNGCGIVLSGEFIFDAIGHATTCWGYVVDNNYSEDEQMHYKMFLISDSDSDKGDAADRRDIPNRIMALELRHGIILDSWQSKNYDSYRLMNYASIKPYSESLEKENDPSATKDKRTTVDFFVSNINVSSYDWELPLDCVYPDSEFSIYSFVKVGSKINYSSYVDIKIDVYNSSGELIKSKKSKSKFDDDFCDAEIGFRNGLPEGEYRVDVTVNPDHKIKEAYYVNNHKSLNFRVVERFGNIDNITVTPDVDAGQVKAVPPTNDLAFEVPFHIDGLTAEQADRIKSVKAELAYNYEDDWYYINGFIDCSYSSSDLHNPDGFDVFVPLSPYHTKENVTLYLETLDGAKIEITDTVVEYSVSEDKLTIPIDEDALELSIVSLKPVTDENGKTNIEYEGLITGAPRELLITENYDNSLFCVDQMYKYYDAKTRQWKGWYDVEDAGYTIVDDGIRVSGILDGSYSKAMISIGLGFDDFYYLTSDEIDIQALIPGTVSVSLSDKSTQDFSPIPSTNKSFAEGEKIILSIQNTGTKTASGTYRLMAEDKNGNLIGLNAKQQFSVEQGKTFETPQMINFDSALSPGVYKLTVQIEGAQAEIADLGTLTVYAESQDIIGDVNCDGVVDVLDAANVQKYAAEKLAFTGKQKELGDVNGDGVVDILDAAEIQKFAAEKITEFSKK